MGAQCMGPSPHLPLHQAERAGKPEKRNRSRQASDVDSMVPDQVSEEKPMLCIIYYNIIFYRILNSSSILASKTQYIP